MSACGKPDTKSTPSDMEVLSERVRNLELSYCKTGEVQWVCQREADGDAALWNGLTCLGTGDSVACSNMKSFIEEDGRPRRTPARRGTYEEDSYSRDMFLGFLAGTLKTRDVNTFNRVLNYLEANNEKLCPISEDGRCNMTYATRTLAVKVGKEIKSLHPLLAKWGDGDLNIQFFAQSKVVRPGYESHLVGVSLWLLKEMRQMDARGESAAEALHKSQSRNAFFAWLSGDNASAANLAAGQVPNVKTEAHNRWTFNTRDDEEPWTGSIGWEFKVLLNLLERK
jgi:hypothetical protein